MSGEANRFIDINSAFPLCPTAKIRMAAKRLHVSNG
jgi:hypothetical protein